MSELLQKVVHAADQRLAEDLIVLDSPATARLPITL